MAKKYEFCTQKSSSKMLIKIVINYKNILLNIFSVISKHLLSISHNLMIDIFHNFPEQ